MTLAIALLVGLAVAAGLYGAWSVFAGAGQRTLRKRARKLGDMGRDAQRSAARAPRLRRESVGGLNGLANRLLPRSNVLRARLLASGTGWSIGRYGVICVVVAGATLAGFLTLGLPAIASVLAGIAAALCLPHLLVGFLLKRRQAKFSKLFPEAIGLMVRGLKAGLPVTDTMLVVGREVADPVGEEFRSITDQIKMGQAIEEAMWTVARRLGLAEFNFLVITFSVQRETGGNLAETLENLEDILRKRQQMRLKIKAMSSEAIASAGIIGCLPFVMSALLFVVSRAYIMSLFTTSLGLVMTAIGGASLAMGIFVMARMVKFEI